MDGFLDFLRQYGWLAAILTNGLIIWVGWSLDRRFATPTAVDAKVAAVELKVRAVADDVTRLERDVMDRLTRIEERQNAAPSHRDLERIHERLDTIAQTASRLDGAVPILNRLSDFLIQAQLEREKS